MKLAENPKKNEEKLSLMVKQAAQAAGFDSPVLYHGTQSFGFTEFELSRMDDGRSIFLTDSNRIASTYSGADGVRKISDKANIPDNLSPIIYASELNAIMSEEEREYGYRYMPFNDEARQKLIERNRAELEMVKMYLYISPRAVQTEKYQKTLNQLNEELRKEYDPENNNISTPLYILTEHAALFDGWQGVNVVDLESNIRLASKLSKLGGETAIVKTGLGGYDVETFTVDEAKELLRKGVGRGNYSLYTKTDGLIKVECSGKYWNNLLFRADISPFFTVISGAHGYRIFNTFTQETLYLANTKSGEYRTSEEAAEKIKAMQTEKSEMYCYDYLNTTRQISKWAQLSGYKGVEFDNIADNGGSKTEIPNNELSNIFVVFSPRDIKSADAVTYDDSGRIIPLSRRFDGASGDIRYDIGDEELQSRMNIAEAERGVTSCIESTTAKNGVTLESDNLSEIVSRLVTAVRSGSVINEKIESASAAVSIIAFGTVENNDGSRTPISEAMSQDEQEGLYAKLQRDIYDYLKSIPDSDTDEARLADTAEAENALEEQGQKPERKRRRKTEKNTQSAGTAAFNAADKTQKKVYRRSEAEEVLRDITYIRGPLNKTYILKNPPANQKSPGVI